MTKLMEKAISSVLELPEDRQDALAELMLDFAGQPSLVTDEQLADIELSKQEAREGKFATDEEMAEVWRLFRR
jgi:predicted transcriptional regulator